MSTLGIRPAISDLDVASLARTGTFVRQGTVELEGPQPSLLSSGVSNTERPDRHDYSLPYFQHSETRNYLLSLPETYVPVRVDGFYALQQAVDAEVVEDGVSAVF